MVNAKILEIDEEKEKNQLKHQGNSLTRLKQKRQQKTKNNPSETDRADSDNRSRNAPVFFVIYRISPDGGLYEGRQYFNDFAQKKQSVKSPTDQENH